MSPVTVYGLRSTLYGLIKLLFVSSFYLFINRHRVIIIIISTLALEIGNWGRRRLDKWYAIAYWAAAAAFDICLYIHLLVRYCLCCSACREPGALGFSCDDELSNIEYRMSNVECELGPTDKPGRPIMIICMYMHT